MSDNNDTRGVSLSRRIIGTPAGKLELALSLTQDVLEKPNTQEVNTCQFMQT